MAPAFQKGGYVRKRDGAETPLVVPHSHYPTQDERWIAIACTNDRIFGRLTRAMGRPELSGDPRYATNAARLQHRHAVNGNILRVWDERVGELAIPNVVPMLLGTPGRVNWLGPTLGSHTDEVMRDVLGITPDQLADLHARGVV